MVCACLSCNVRKGGMTPHEAGMRLLSTPVKPKRSPLIARQLMLKKYAAWKAFHPSGARRGVLMSCTMTRMQYR